MTAATTFPPVALDPEMAKRLRAAATKARDHTRQRDELIRQAAAAGASLRDIAEHVGLSHTGVKKIVDRG